MNRRKFFKNGSLFTLGTALINPFEGISQPIEEDILQKNKKAKNIIILVSDGMSSGTLNMADLYLNRKMGRGSNWLNLYRENKVTRGVMDMASANSIITDSAAASSSWGGGFRVKNGALNIGVNGEEYLPLWQKFKLAGKMAGCVTTVPITHATPAGFCVNNKSRNSQEDIAEQYLNLKFDIMMGGGQKYFDASLRKDKKDIYANYKSAGYQVVKTRSEMLATTNDKPILGVFSEDSLPYSIDRTNAKELQESTPSLAEMTQKAIDRMKSHKNGFVLQVEAGKVDWAAHANDVAGLLYDQIAFDDCIKIAMEFAEKDKETLVIITTDHGNSNPGIVYGKYADDNFDTIHNYKYTNEWILNKLNPNSTLSQIKEGIEHANNFVLTDDEANLILSYYEGIKKSDEGLYNYKNLPFKAFSEIQYNRNSVSWLEGMQHTADFTEIAMFGPGSKNLKPFIKNTELHYLMLEAAEVENKF